MPIKERPYCVSYRKKQMQSLHDTRTKAHFIHSICLHPKYTEDTQNSHYVHAYYRPRIFHFNPFIGHRKEAKNDAQLVLLAKHA